MMNRLNKTPDLVLLVPSILNFLKSGNFNYVVTATYSGILSEGDDVKYVFIPFRNEDEAQMFAVKNHYPPPVTLKEAEHELTASVSSRSEIRFYIEKKYTEGYQA